MTVSRRCISCGVGVHERGTQILQDQPTGSHAEALITACSGRCSLKPLVCGSRTSPLPTPPESVAGSQERPHKLPGFAKKHCRPTNKTKNKTLCDFVLASSIFVSCLDIVRLTASLFHVLGNATWSCWTRKTVKNSRAQRPIFGQLVRPNTASRIGLDRSSKGRASTLSLPCLRRMRRVQAKLRNGVTPWNEDERRRNDEKTGEEETPTFKPFFCNKDTTSVKLCHTAFVSHLPTPLARFRQLLHAQSVLRHVRRAPFFPRVRRRESVAQEITLHGHLQSSIGLAADASRPSTNSCSRPSPR